MTATDRNRAPACSTSPLTSRARARRPASPRCSSSPPTRRRWGRASARSPPIARSASTWRIIRTARPRRCAKRSARSSGSIPARIVCGAGSDDLLNLLARAYLKDGDEAIHATHGFLVYPIATLAAGAKPVVAPETNYTVNVDAMLKAVTPKTKIVFLANPNNPTGTYIPFDEVKRLHKGLPPHVLLVLDAAYAEYVQRNDYESGIELVATSENVVMCRTFSKIYGLAALRLGWMYGPAHVVDAINRIRGPFNVNAPAIAAGIAAIRDTAHVERSRAHNTRWLAWLTEEIGKLGLEVTPSVANFVLIHFPREPGRTAKEADAFLTKRGLILRQVAGYKLPNALRMSVGTEEANRLMVKALAEFLGKPA